MARPLAGSGALWLADRGWYADYRNSDGFVEDHLMIDSLTLLRFNAIPETRARSVLAAVAQRLESRNNREQSYGDWGVLCAFPPYRRRSDTRAKSAFPFRYHNGGDWPYWDAVYAEERLRRGMPGWRYPLLRWWQTCLDQGWAGAVEYFSPPFGRGSLLRAGAASPRPSRFVILIRSSAVTKPAPVEWIIARAKEETR